MGREEKVNPNSTWFKKRYPNYVKPILNDGYIEPELNWWQKLWRWLWNMTKV